jgi:hypothetical protein
MSDDRNHLAAAYQATTYVVDAPDGPLSLRVGRTHADLDRLLARHGVTSWAFVTAYNPGSIRLDDTANRARQRQLEEAARALGKAVLPGRGVGDDGTWPPEESLLVLGISEPEAVSLGRRFGQAAVVCGETGAPARLAWIDPA